MKQISAVLMALSLFITTVMCGCTSNSKSENDTIVKVKIMAVGVSSNSGIEQAKENLRLNRDYYNAGISKMSDLLEAQLLYQQALDSRTDVFVAYQIKALKYRQATAQ